MATPELQELASWRSDATDAAGIDAALVRAWNDAARPAAGADGDRPPEAGAVRTRIANLLVYAGSADEAEHAQEVLGRVIRRHPIRSLLCEARPDAGRDTLSASLRIYCEPSAGRRVCFEQIRVSADVAATPQLGSVATMLLVHDLPTVLWCPGSPHFGGPELAGLSDLADLVVVDSAEFGGQTNGLASMAQAPGGRRRWTLADLNWNRLTDWREVIAQFFDTQSARPLMDQIRRVELLVAASGAQHVAGPAQALLMAAWLGSRLGWQCSGADTTAGELRLAMRRGAEPVEVRIGASDKQFGGGMELCSVRIEAGPEDGVCRLSLAASESAVDGTAMLEICEGEGTSRCFVFAERDEADLLGEEIETFGRERALDDALDLLPNIVEAMQQ